MTSHNARKYNTALFSAQVEIAIKIQLNCPFLSTIKAKPLTNLNTFYSHVCFQFTINLNIIIYWKQPNKNCFFSEVSRPSQKSICLQFIIPIIIKTRLGASAGPQW